MRLIFMGTPDFAVPSLLLLLAHRYEIAAVVTAPDKPRGRGQKVTPSPVKTVALAHQLPILQPASLTSPDFLAALQRYQAHLQIVVAFRMLPQAVWALPPHGTFNLHASLLPAYRGAAPINWAIINGEQETGVTTFFIDESMDTGQVIFQDKTPIHPHDTAGTLHERLKHQGAQLVLQTVRAIERGACPRTPQAPTPASLHKKAPKLHKKDCLVNWHQPATAVVNFIRGLSPYPAAWAVWEDKTYKILQATVAQDCSVQLQPGETCTNGQQRLLVGTQTVPVAIEILQPAGKKPMDVRAFLCGNQLG